MYDGTALIGIPKFRLHVLSGGILAYFPVKGDTSHDGAFSVFFDFLSVDIKQ